MPIMLDHFGLTVPGHVVKKSDGLITTLTITLDQAKSIHEDLTHLLAYIAPDDCTWPTESPDPPLPPPGERFGGPPPQWTPPSPPAFNSTQDNYSLEDKLATATKEAEPPFPTP